MSKCCNNKIKKLATLLLFIASVASIGLGALLYLTGFLRTNRKVMHGSKVLTHWNLNYEGVSVWISYAAYASCGSGLIGLLAAKCKKPYTACLYILAASGAGLLCLYASSIALTFKINNREAICDISKEGKTIENQWQVLINKYMYSFTRA